MEFGQLPSLQSPVTVAGYPIGGVAISVTQGVVSRIEVTAYSHGSSELLGLQIDAAINSGNSGGPAFNSKGECVGVAFQSLKHDDAENIGYVIPTPVIVHFITDYDRKGKYTGFPTLGLEWQKLENPNMRKYLNMKNAQHGVFVRRVSPCLRLGESSNHAMCCCPSTACPSGTTVPCLSARASASRSTISSRKNTPERRRG